MPANDHQVGGRHYKTAYEHWDLVLDTGMGYLDGCATKYIARHRKKNGQEDLQKALHYVNKLIEASRANKVVGILVDRGEAVNRFALINDLTSAERRVIYCLVHWESEADLLEARDMLLQLMDIADPLSQDAPAAQPVPLTEENHHAERVGETDEGRA